MNCICWWAPGPYQAAWTRPPAEAGPGPRPSCAASAPPPWTSTGNTSKRMPPGAPLPARVRGRARRGGRHLHPARPEGALRAAPRRAHPGRGPGGRGQLSHRTSPTASCPTRPWTLWTRPPAPSACSWTAGPLRSTSGSAGRLQLQLERHSLTKEKDAASRARLADIEKELAELNEELSRLRAQWENEKKGDRGGPHHPEETG